MAVTPVSLGLTPLAGLRTLEPNGMALGPCGSQTPALGGTCPNGSLSPALYITGLTEQYVRRITGPGGDPRSGTLSVVVAHTGDNRRANGSIGFIGNKLHIHDQLPRSPQSDGGGGPQRQDRQARKSGQSDERIKAAKIQ